MTDTIPPTSDTKLTTPYQLTGVALDVSELVPPEPLLAIFKALTTLAPHHRLDVYHRRQPIPLYAMLDQAGYLYQCVAVDSHYQIQIWPGDQANVAALERLVLQAPACT